MLRGFHSRQDTKNDFVAANATQTTTPPVSQRNLFTMETMTSCIVNSCGDLSIAAVPSQSYRSIWTLLFPMKPQHMVRSCSIVPVTATDSFPVRLVSTRIRKASRRESILVRQALGDTQPRGTCTPPPRIVTLCLGRSSFGTVGTEGEVRFYE